MEFDLTMKDLIEIEKNYDKLVSWMGKNFSSFTAEAFILQTLMNAVNEAKEQLENE